MFFVFLANFVLFLAGASYFGGDAINGKVEDGHFYLYGMRTDRQGNKVYTEVSERVFSYSRWHAYCLVATFLVVMATAGVENLARKHAAQD